MTAKATIKKTIDPDSNVVREIDWHGIKVGSTKSNYNIKLLKLLVSDKSQLSSECPLCWLLNPVASSNPLTQVRKWHQIVARNPGREATKKMTRLAAEIIQCLDAIDLNSEDPGDALRVLAACHALRAIAGNCEFEDWAALVSRIIQISKVAKSNVQLEPYVYQWLAIEVPLTVAFQIPEIEDFQQMGEQSCQKLATAISDMLDTDGWPSARYLSEFGPLAASWVRSTAIASKIGVDLIYESASQLEWMVRQVLRMLRPDGTLVFSDRQSVPISDMMLNALFKLTHDPADKPLKKLFVSGSTTQVNPKRLPEPSNLSEWAESAVLQSEWRRTTPKIAVDFADQGCRVEICRRVNLIQGDAMPNVSVNGVLQTPPGGFDVVCSEHDDDVDYLELEMQMENHVTLTRQILLSRHEEFLLIADAVVPEKSSKIEYQCHWPLAPGIVGLHETETREVYLRDKKIQSLVLPLALPEWKVGRSEGRLDFLDNQLQLAQSVEGRGLYAPLFFDLNPKRSQTKRTWRQLTVGENLNPVSRDVACAYRIQINQQQWVFYRKISSAGNRTFMGENFSGEFVFNRFEKSGTVTQLIEIQ